MSTWSLGNLKIIIIIFLFSDLFPRVSSPVVHRELTDGREGAAEKAGWRWLDNQTEQKEAQAHPTAAHVPTAQGKLSI